MTTTTPRFRIPRVVVIGLTVATVVTLGAAAATATGVAPWSPPAAPHLATAAEPPGDTTVPAVTQEATTVPDTSAPEATEPPATEPPATEPPATEPPATDPPATTPAAPTTSDEGKVPLGITLHCSMEGTTVSCHWSGGVVDGFQKFLVLRGDGGPTGRVPFVSADPAADTYIDTGLAPGSYSYVVVTVDEHAQPLVHSNPVHVQIAAPA